jgi:tRNA(Ile)-lysidine synthase
MDRVDGAIAAFHPKLPFAVAYSGGADSSALLHACARRWPGQVRAVHVHHGLQAAADGFAQHCVATCALLGVPLVVRRVDARHAPGQSPEEAARRMRYDTLHRPARRRSGRDAVAGAFTRCRAARPFGDARAMGA